jgi:hypothetical protein
VAARALLGAAALQVATGAWVSIGGGALPLHGILAVALTGLAAWYALARGRRLLFAAALAAPLAGMTALHFEYSPLAAALHTLAAALLVCALAAAWARTA